MSAHSEVVKYVESSPQRTQRTEKNWGDLQPVSIGSRRGAAGFTWHRLAPAALLWFLLPVVQMAAQDLNDIDFSRWQFIARTYRPPLTGTPFSFSGSATRAIGDRIRSGRLTSDEKFRLLSSLYSSKSTDLKAIIDQTWGQGLPTDQKLQIFDQFWQTVDQKFACFHDLSVDWTALRDKYRSEVAGGVSRGRFAAIMNQLSIQLQESHTK